MATNVEIEFPVPADASTPHVRTSMGTSAYSPERDALLWKIKSFLGGKVSCSFHWFSCSKMVNSTMVLDPDVLVS